jgi:hypothetical protein
VAHTLACRPKAVSEGYGEAVPPQLFVFLQLEFPWALGPPDGRYLLRDGAEAEPERVVVLETLGAPLRNEPAGWLARRAGAGRERDAEPQPEPAQVTTTRVTVIDPVPLSADVQAQAWLDELDRERDVEAALEIVNRVVHHHRIASADPYVREVSAPQALVVRAGWGEGEQVAIGQWLTARELSSRPRRGGRRGRERSAALRPQERLAALMGGRSRSLLCEELALRARLDLDQGRPGLAAVGLERALTAAVPELGGEGRQDMALRIAELDSLREGIAGQSRHALDGDKQPLDGDLLEHALGRLEAALRARTAAGL